MKKKLLTKKYLGLFLLILCLSFHGLVLAKDNYIYRKRANWVKLDKLSSKQMAGQTLKHPYTEITVDQMTAMLMSLKMNQGQAFKKGFKTSEIFSEVEARKYAPLIVKGLNEAAPNQVVNMAIVHRRPYFVMRNDNISIINVFVTDDGIHFNFDKLFARLDGDYQQATHIDKAILDAKSLRVNLASSAGQVLLPEVDELVLDVHHNFGDEVKLAGVTDDAETTTSETTPKNKNSKKTAKVKNEEPQTPVVTTADTTRAPASQDVTTRLKTLEQLKKSNLITAAEYQKKRADILNGL